MATQVAAQPTKLIQQDDDDETKQKQRHYERQPKKGETLNNNSLNVSEKAEATKKVHVSGEMVVFVAKKSIL